jgi:hypothetical protein
MKLRDISEKKINAFIRNKAKLFASKYKDLKLDFSPQSLDRLDQSRIRESLAAADMETKAEIMGGLMAYYGEVLIKCVDPKAIFKFATSEEKKVTPTKDLAIDFFNKRIKSIGVETAVLKYLRGEITLKDHFISEVLLLSLDYEDIYHKKLKIHQPLMAAKPSKK